MGEAAARVPLRLLPDAAIFLGGAGLVALVVGRGVPALVRGGVDPLAAWMLLSVPCVFAPIIASGLWLLRSERGREPWRERLRLAAPGRRDWLCAGLGLIAMGLGSAAMFRACTWLGWSPDPPFARDLQPLTGGRLWMLGVWAVYWPVNILGEELVWRGVVLPRMEARLGRSAWLLNALLWGSLHVAFGAGNLLVLSPTLIVVPLIAQRRRSTWLAVLLHAGLSGPGFLALALGLA